MTLDYTDSSLKYSVRNNEEIKLEEIIITAEGIDNIPYRHEAHLTGYLLEREVITKMKNKPPQMIK